jgi:hypothetical protein
MTATYLRKRVLTCVGIQNMFAYIANVLVDAIYVYSYSLGMVLQQKRLEANKVDDCKCFAHDKKTKCLRDKTFRPNFRQKHFAQNDAKTTATSAVGCLSNTRAIDAYAQTFCTPWPCTHIYFRVIA